MMQVGRSEACEYGPTLVIKALASQGGVGDGAPMRPTVLLIALTCAILSALVRPGKAADEVDSDTAAREALFNKVEAAQISERLHAEPRMLRSFEACPADAFARERPFWRGLAEPRRPTERTCALHPAECYSQCVGWANGPACFNAAQAFEHHSLDTPDELDRQRLHALACAMGYPAGCTNRAAGIRNGQYRDDPFRTVLLATKQACEYRSFLIDCDRRGAWGCAMLGQAYRNGKGVASQPKRARAAFEASCEISPNFAACDFAKRQLKLMDRAVPPERESTGSDSD